MNIVLINEPRSKYNKSWISLEASFNTQFLILATTHRLQLITGETVRINVALPHKPASWSKPILFTADFQLCDTSYEPLDKYTNLCMYTFSYPLEVRQSVYALPKTRVSGKVVFE